MKRRLALAGVFALLAFFSSAPASIAIDNPPATQPIDKRSGFYTFETFQEQLPSGEAGPGRGTIAGIACTNTSAAVGGNNFSVNCDTVGPHNETTIAANPTNAANVIAGSHSYLITQVGETLNVHVIATAFVTKDSGATWVNVHPPLGGWQFTGDPVLAFDADGRAYYFNIADHEGQGGPFTNVSVIAQRSDDGGTTWTDPATVAKGQGAISFGGLQVVVFNDKEWGTADANAGSPFKNNVYVTWTRFLFEHNQYIESPIFFSKSTDSGKTWTPGKEISGKNATLCSAQLNVTGGGDRCDEDQFSQPVVAPDGTIYVSFLNEQRVGDGQFRDQVLVVKSTDGGDTWSAPKTATPLIHDGFNDYPLNIDGRQRLSGCAYRVNASGALAVAATGQLYLTYTENKSPGAGPTQTDIMVVTSTDGGATWSAPATVNTSTKDQTYSWATVGTDGKLRVGYIDHARRGPSGQTCVYGYTLSTATTAGGTTFTNDRLESAVSVASDSRWFRTSAADHNTRFIGDYFNVATSPDGRTWADWTDMRETVTLFGSTGKDEDTVVAVHP